MTNKQSPLASEPTPAGEQTLVPCVAPITARDRLQARIAAPIRPERQQQPCNVGLFDDDARAQTDLFGGSS